MKIELSLNVPRKHFKGLGRQNIIHEIWIFNQLYFKVNLHTFDCQICFQRRQPFTLNAIESIFKKNMDLQIPAIILEIYTVSRQNQDSFESTDSNLP